MRLISQSWAGISPIYYARSLEGDQRKQAVKTEAQKGAEASSGDCTALYLEDSPVPSNILQMKTQKQWKKKTPKLRPKVGVDLAMVTQQIWLG